MANLKMLKIGIEWPKNIKDLMIEGPEETAPIIVIGILGILTFWIVKDSLSNIK